MPRLCIGNLQCSGGLPTKSYSTQCNHKNTYPFPAEILWGSWTAKREINIGHVACPGRPSWRREPGSSPGVSPNLLQWRGTPAWFCNMFVLVEMKDTVRIKPWYFGVDLREAITNKLNKKLANKVWERPANICRQFAGRKSNFACRIH